MKNYSFKPTDKDIFKKDSRGNTIYLKWGKGFIVNDARQQSKLLSLEGYSGLICSIKPAIFIPIMIFSFMISVGLSFIVKVDVKLELLMVEIGLPIYIMICLIYINRIYQVIKNNKKISANEKQQILKKEEELNN